MTTYTLLDDETGKQYEIEAPEGTSEGDLLQAIAAQKHQELREAVNPKRMDQALVEGLKLGGMGISEALGYIRPKTIKAYKTSIASERPDTQLTQKIGELLPGVLAASVGTAPLSMGISGAVKAGVPYLSRTLRALSPLAEGATAGGIAGGVSPEEEAGKQAENAKVGAAIGAGIPSVLLPAAATVRVFKDLLTHGGQTRNAARFIANILPKADAENAVATAAGMGKDPVLGTVHTVPAETNDIRLQALQRGVMSKYPEVFKAQERTNNELRRKALRQMVPTTSQVDDLWKNKEALTTLYKMNLQELLAPNMPGLENAFQLRLDNAVKGTDKHQVILDALNMIKAPNGQLSDLNKLREIRSQITSSMDGLPTGPFKAARSEEQAMMQNLNLVDTELNRITAGRWQRYLDAQHTLSKPIDEAEAVTKIVSDVLPKSNISVDNITNALRAHRNNKWGSNLTPQVENKFNLIKDDLGKEVSSYSVNPSSFEGALNKELDTISQLEWPIIGRHPLVGALRVSRTFGKTGRSRAVKDLLTDPELFNKEVTKALRNKYEGPSALKKTIQRVIPTMLDEDIVSNFGDE